MARTHSEDDSRDSADDRRADDRRADDRRADDRRAAGRRPRREPRGDAGADTGRDTGRRRVTERASAGRERESTAAERRGAARHADRDPLAREPRGRRGRWGRRLLTLVLLLAALVGAAPTIVTRTPLRDKLLTFAGGKSRLQIAVDGLQFGWITPLRVDGLRVRDEEGRPLAEVGRIELDRTLVGLLRDRANLGTARVDGPVVHVQLRPNGSNWEDSLAKLPAGGEGGSSPAVRVELADGRVLFEDEAGVSQASLEGLKVDLEMAPTSQAPLVVHAGAQVTAGGTAPGSFALDLNAADKRLRAAKGELQAESLPLELLEAVGGRFAPGWLATGRATLDGAFEFSLDSQQHSLLLRKLEATEMSLAGPGLPAGDTLRLQLLRGSGGIRAAGTRWFADNLQLESEIASVTLVGELDTVADDKPLWQLGPGEQVQLGGQVDLARLAAMVPGLLRVKQDTEIQQGRLMVSLVSQEAEGLRTWRGQVEAAGIHAVAAGRPVQWDQPVRLDFHLAQSEHDWSIEQLDCDSSFLQLEGRGTLAGGKVDLHGDLGRLRTELTQFIDLGDVHLAGTFDGAAQWQQTAAGWDASGNLQLEQVEAQLPGKSALREPQLTMTCQLQGRLEGRDLRELRAADLSLVAGEDRLEARLLRPIADLGREEAPLSVRLDGAIERWLMRVATLSGNQSLQGSGVVHLAADVQVPLSTTPTLCRVIESTIDATPCQLAGLGPVVVDEPALKITAQGVLDLAAGRWTGGPTTLASSSVAARSDNLVVQWGEQGSLVAGDAGFRGDLARIVRLAAPELATSTRLEGQIQGTARLRQQLDKIRFELNTQVDSFTLAQRATATTASAGAGRVPAATNGGWRPLWQDARVNLVAVGEYQGDAVDFERLQIEDEAIRLAARGSLRDIAARLDAELEGELTYDLGQLNGLLQPMLGPTFSIEGSSQRPLSLRGPLRVAQQSTAMRLASAGEPGPLAPPELTAQAGLNWQAIRYRGVTLGPGELKSSLERSVLSFDPLDFPLSGGHLRLAPQIDLSTNQPVLRNQGPASVDHLQIEPEMCRTWLKYVAPPFADAAQVEGTFSAQVDQLDLPLSQPLLGTMQGGLTIHGARVGPGPFTQQLLAVTKQAEGMIRSIRDGKGGAGGNPLSSLDLNRAMDMLEQGQVFDSQGRFDPKRALGGLFGGTAGTPGAAGAAAGQTPPPAAQVTWVTVPEHTVGFHLSEGRVYHQGMRMLVDDVEVRTSGAVGFDQSLQLVAELTIPDKWLGQEPWLAALKGQALRIPIQGNLRKPQMDVSAVRQLGQHLLQTAARGAAQNAVQRYVPQQLQQDLQGLIPGMQAPGGAAPGGQPSGLRLPNLQGILPGNTGGTGASGAGTSGAGTSGAGTSGAGTGAPTLPGGLQGAIQGILPRGPAPAPGTTAPATGTAVPGTAVPGAPAPGTSVPPTGTAGAAPAPATPQAPAGANVPAEIGRALQGLFR